MSVHIRGTMKKKKNLKLSNFSIITSGRVLLMVGANKELRRGMIPSTVYNVLSSSFLLLLNV